MNLNEMRAMIRRDLHDEEAGSYRWTDGEIDRNISRAVREFSHAVPEERSIAKATTGGSRSLDIADLADRVMVEAVEYPASQFPPQFQRFSVWGDLLTLLGQEVPDGSEARIYYGKVHTLDAAGSTVPRLYEDLVAEGAAGYAAVQWALYAINRVNTGGIQTPDALLAWGKANLELFCDHLKTAGRNNRVRARSLYLPFKSIKSGSTDYGQGGR
jgi:hypothetical protein